MKLAPSPLKELPSFIDMLKGGNVALDNMMPRWWMECDYEPIARSSDGLGFEIRGRGVKVLTEEEVADAQGQVAGTGKANPVARKWADLMTQHYDELSVKNVAFGELRNVFDMCVIAALIAKERLLDKADCQLPTLTSSGSLGFTALEAPKTVETQTSALKRGSAFIVTASGGVAITSWQAASKMQTRPEVGQVREKAMPVASASRPWWD